ncbi:MAG: hypothetical protein ACHQC8_06425 [Solirubrobacterales bacterium]
MSIDEIGVPALVAGVLGYPMPVMPGPHLRMCRALLASGEGWSRCVLGGNEYVRMTLPAARFGLLAKQVRAGDVVYRNLRDGDLCIANRQPTLHRNGFTAHVVRVLPDMAFHLPNNITEPFNADFDGDEAGPPAACADPGR